MLLFTPGPLNTSTAVRQAMANDYGSRTQVFTDMTKDVIRRLHVLSDADDRYGVVPMQGSGTFAIEAMLGSLVRGGGRLLVLINGAYGERIFAIARRLGINVVANRYAETEQVSALETAHALDADPSIIYVALVHGETTTGILNPLKEVADVVHSRGRRILVDAMATFAGTEIRMGEYHITALVASSNKCLEGAPGIGFVIVDKHALNDAGSNPHSICLDLWDQDRHFTKNGQWRFTPPTHVLAALHEALVQIEMEGGARARHGRHLANRNRIAEGFRKLGFEALLPEWLQGTTILTYTVPNWAWFRTEEFLSFLEGRQIYLYPGKLTQADTFRVGCIGDVSVEDIDRMLDSVGEYIAIKGDNLIQRTASAI